VIHSSLYLPKGSLGIRPLMVAMFPHPQSYIDAFTRTSKSGSATTALASRPRSGRTACATVWSRLDLLNIGPFGSFAELCCCLSICRYDVSSVALQSLSGLVALLLGFGLMQMGNTFQGTLLSIRGSISGFSPIEIGAVGSAFWAGS
jgi:hypothetical protein